MTPLREQYVVVRRRVRIEHFDETQTSLPGWYWRDDGDTRCHGPHPTQDAAIEAAKQSDAASE